jgi:predicted permease
VEPEVRPVTLGPLQRAIVRLLAPRGERRDITGDLEDEAAQIAATRGPKAAAGFLWWQILHSIGPWVWRRGAGSAAAATRSTHHMQRGLWSDVRLGARRLVRSPGFSVLAVTMLAIGIGAVSTVFSLAHALWLKPLPYADPDRLAWIQARHIPSSSTSSLTAAELAEYSQAGRAFASVAGVSYSAGIARVNGEPVRVVSHFVTPNLFRVLGVRPAIGRDFSEADAAPGARVVMLGHHTWARRFGSDPAIAGKTMTISGEAYEIAGVMPSGFAFPRGLEADVWPAASLTRERESPRRILQAVGRLAPGRTIAEATAEVDTRARRLAQTMPATNREWTAVAAPAGATASPSTKVAFQALLGIVGLFLLIACTNLAGLLLARNVVRRRELAVRLSIGASRWQLTRMLLVESVLLAAVGGAAGVMLSGYGSRTLAALMPRGTSGLDAIGPNPQVIGIAVAATVASAALIALLPALSLGSLGPAEALAGSRGSTGLASRTQRGLVVAEIVLAVILIVGAGAMLRSFLEALGRDRGYDPRGLQAINVSLPFSDDSYLDTTRRARAFGDILDRVSAVPGVRQVGATTGFPGSPLGILGGAPIALPDGRAPVMAAIHAASTGYFEAMRVPIKRGRPFAATDTASTPGVAIVNEQLAQQFPVGNPIGRTVTLSILGDTAAPFEIVGVAGNISLTGSAGNRIFVPLAQASPYWIDLVFRTDDRRGVLADVRRSLRGMSADLLIENDSSFDAIISNSLALQRTQSGFAIMIGVLSAVVAGVGLFALVTFMVAGRRREFGIRLALGSEPRRLFRDALALPMRLVAAGLVSGLVVAVLLVRALGSQVFGLKSADATAYLAAAALVFLVSLGAAWFPARRAMRTDPLAALREE